MNKKRERIRGSELALLVEHASSIGVFVVEGKRGVRLEGIEVFPDRLDVHVWMAAQPPPIRGQRNSRRVRRRKGRHGPTERSRQHVGLVVRRILDRVWYAEGIIIHVKVREGVMHVRIELKPGREQRGMDWGIWDRVGDCNRRGLVEQTGMTD